MAVHGWQFTKVRGEKGTKIVDFIAGAIDLTDVEGQLRFYVLVGLAVLALQLLSVPELHALESMNEEEMSDVSGSEGLAIDIDLDATIDGLAFIDNDDGGAIQLGVSGNSANVSLTSSGTLTGLTINAMNSPAQIVIGAPSGTFDVTSDKVFLGSGTNLSNGGSSAFEFRAEGIDVSNTTVNVGAD